MRRQRNFDRSLSEYAIMKFARPTFNTWMKLCPNSNREQWKMYAKPNALKDFSDDRLSSVFPGIYESFSKLSIVVTFDEEYIVWLHGREDTEWMQQEYINSLKAKDVLRLAQKNGFNNTYFIYALPIPITINELTRPTKRKLTKETQSALIEMFQKVCLNTQVYVSPHLMNIETIVAEEELLIKMARNYFRTSKQDDILWIENVCWDNTEDVPCFAIPIVFKYEHNDIIMNPEKLSKDIPFKWDYRWVNLNDFFDSEEQKAELLLQIKNDLCLQNSLDNSFNLIQFAEIIGDESKNIYTNLKQEGYSFSDRNEYPVQMKENDCLVDILYKQLKNDKEEIYETVEENNDI